MEASAAPRPAVPADADAPSAPLGTFIGFGAMGLGMFMAILDVQIVATSLPTIQEDLAMAQDQASWIQTAYLIAEIVSIPLTGVLTRRLGLRRLFAISVLVFTLASCGCAASSGFGELIAWRVLQGFSGGTLIPSVFSAVFLLFPYRQQGLTTTAAGVLAVLAPTVGPIVGGYITGTFSWHWLFLINVLPGVLAIAGGLAFLPRRVARKGEGVSFDALSLFLLASSLAALEIALKDGPHLGWLSLEVSGLLAWALLGSILLVRRAARSKQPLVDFTLLTNRNFAIGSALSFVLGIGLFGSVYLMPIFLAYVRGHGALAIGEIMLVTGIAQLISAPIAVALERRVDPRLLTAFGFALFARRDRHERGADRFDRCRRNVLAAGRARLCHHVLPVAADAPCAGPSAAGGDPGRQRAVQPNAQSRRRHRPRPDRHDHLRRGRRPRRGDRRQIEGGRCGNGRPARRAGVSFIRRQHPYR